MSRESLLDLWDSIQRRNINIIVIPEGKERENGVENLVKELIAENFQCLGIIGHPSSKS